MQAIPLMLSNRDILAAAPTGTFGKLQIAKNRELNLLIPISGSGKTAAFVLPVLSSVVARNHGGRRGLQALLLAPTRELTEQIHREAERLAAGKRLKIGVLKKNVASAALAKQVSNSHMMYSVMYV